ASRRLPRASVAITGRNADIRDGQAAVDKVARRHACEIFWNHHTPRSRLGWFERARRVDGTDGVRLRLVSIAGAVPSIAGVLLAGGAMAHSVSEQAQQRMLIGGFTDAAWIGAEHMLTGYDHLLFLLGVMLFLTRFSQIVVFITAFTAGHTITLLFATLAGITANPYLVDAVIALTVTYTAIENMDGFRRWFGRPAPNLLVMVFVFGLIH